MIVAIHKALLRLRQAATVVRKNYRFEISGKVKRVFLTLLFCLWLTELHSLLAICFPKPMALIIDRFFQPGFHSQYWNLEWWCKATFDNFFIIIAFFVGANYMKNQKVAALYRWFGVYYTLDTLLFYWNAKSTAGTFYILLIVTSVILMLLTIKRKQIGAIIVELQENEQNNGD